MKIAVACIVTLAAGVAATAECPGQHASEFTLEYAEPLLSFEKTCGSRIGGPIGINKLATTTTLADPQKTATVKPNLDTLYMSQCYDLSSQNIEVTVPEVKDRFWSLSLYSPYGDNFINLGSINDTGPGKYLVSPLTSPDSIGKLLASPSPEYKGVISTTDTLGFLLVRLLLRDNGPDLAVVNTIQTGFSTRLVNRTVPMRIGPEMNKDLFANSTDGESKPDHVLTLASRFVDTVPRYLGQSRSTCGTEAKLARAGVLGYGVVNKPACVDLSVEYTVASTKIGSYINDTARALGHGWQLPPPGAIGSYGSNYLARASIARWAYLALTPDVALYPSYKTLFSLQPNESYTVRFSRKPVLKKLGFWSLTLYDVQGYLLNNPIGRYAVGDRSNLTFPDGSRVSEPGKDGEFEILVQGAEPPAGQFSNWLPSPQSNASFELVLRFFEALPAMTDGTWKYPIATKSAAVLK